MATLVVTRRGVFGFLRRLKIELDGEVLLKLPTGATVDAEVAPGLHRVVAKMDLARNPALEVTCRDEEPTRVEVIVPRPLLAPYQLFLAPSRVFQVREV